MTTRIGYLPTTIGRKQIMAIAGLGLCLFVLAHVAGNFLLFYSAEAYNMYAYKLTSNPLIYFAEAGLIAFFLTHVVSGVVLSIRNRAARPEGYAVQASGEKKTTINKKALLFQGIVIFVFVVLHLITFKFGPKYEVTYGDLVVRDLFKLVVEVFQSPVYVAWYVVTVLLLAGHLAHGLESALQTLGFNHPRYTPRLKLISLGYGLFVGLGFAAQPLYILLFYQG